MGKKALLIGGFLLFLGFAAYVSWFLPAELIALTANAPSDDDISPPPKVVRVNKNTGPKTMSPNLVLDQSLAGTEISSPLNLSGAARLWYFEGSFPIYLEDVNGQTIAQSYGTAQGEWMTTDFVPFKAELKWDKVTTPDGALVLRKDNPSGDPAREEVVKIPVRFAVPVVPAVCHPTGCSGELCSDQDLVSTCEYRDVYSCFKTATCKRQADGTCGWTPDKKLESCILKFKK